MLNQCTMMGRLTRDPEVRYTQSAEPKAVAKFGLAVDRDYTTQGEKITDFFEVEAWQKTAEFAEKYLKKGQLVAIEGKLRRSEWKQPETGEKRYSYYIEARSIYFAEGKKEEKKTEKTEAKKEPVEYYLPQDDEPASGGFDPFAESVDPFAA